VGVGVGVGMGEIMEKIRLNIKGATKVGMALTMKKSIVPTSSFE
jgi:hypothetical protein